MDNQEALWTYLKTPAMEHLYLMEEDGWLWADGLILSLGRLSPHRIHYFIRFDQQWRVRNLRLQVAGHRAWSLEKRVNDDWQWMEYYGVPEQHLSGCSAFDISFSLVTKSLAVRQLNLSPREKGELQVAYLDGNDFKLKSAMCRYTYLEKEDDKALYRYENLLDGSILEFQLDHDELMIESPNILERVWPVFCESAS